MQSELLYKLKELKPKLQREGFELLGVFGSYARDEETSKSDIDLLYKINDMDAYLKKYEGWDSILHIVKIKEFLKKELKKDVDFVDRDTLSSIRVKFILKDLVII